MRRSSATVVAGLVTATAAFCEPSVERGEYLAEGLAGCGNCHTPIGPEGPVMEMNLAGRLVEDIEPFRAVAPNITPGGRVAGWSDAELARAIREGIRPDGSVIGPPMPSRFYRGLSDEDLASIVMYLRTVPAVANDPGESEYRIPLPPAWGPPVESVAQPDESDPVAYGEYLAGPVAHCMECHSTPGPMGAMLDTHLGAGGWEFHGPWGVSVSANLTPHPEDGIVSWTDAELVQMITQGVRPGGAPMLPPMGYGYYARATSGDLAAIVAYLRSLPALPDPM
ncbi:c-type cytochrome [Histidinibacterium lentulum]|uniref:Cytochrome C n=1 Tax=Histidinibacterium lentulum TaxID=2480588 RepID=A0A3N2R4F5_9RHOB|nr:cytochrome C [Histidinibacterium lentulum]ROU02364.1 cytochrome C [Histidinibacterium lentulum]